MRRHVQHDSHRPQTEPDKHDSWGGWVLWAPEDDDTDLGSELWGAGFFLGAYPVKGRLGVIIGGPNEDTTAGAEPFIASVRRRLTATNPRIESMLDSVAQAPDPYYWPWTAEPSPRCEISR